MGHHGNYPDYGDSQQFEQIKKHLTGINKENQPDLSELLKNESVKNNLGATGKFPDGKLGTSDEGEIMFGIAQLDGRVILNFGKPVSWMGLTKEQAKDIAESLLKHSL